MRIYGPVPSRRFGLSLGVDVLPFKACTFDCIYCQLGSTDETVGEPDCFYKLEVILRDVKNALDAGPTPDVMTLAGSGEPTLYSKLGDLIDGLHALAPIPVLLITNSSLLWCPEVAEAVKKADILAPSLDAGDQETYRRVNQPHHSIPFDLMFEGLKKATHAHPGEVHLEVMIIDSVNDDEQSLRTIAQKLKALRFDRIDINTPVRPPVPGRGALPASEAVLARATELFGPLSHPIGKFEKRESGERSLEKRRFIDRDKDIREMLLRRPCTLRDIVASLSFPQEVVVASLNRLLEAGLVEVETSDDGAYYHVPSKHATLID